MANVDTQGLDPDEVDHEHEWEYDYTTPSRSCNICLATEDIDDGLEEEYDHLNNQDFDWGPENV